MGENDRSGQSLAERHNKDTGRVRCETVDICEQHLQSVEICQSRKRQWTVEIDEERMEEEKKHTKEKKKHKKERKKHKKEKKKHKKEKKKHKKEKKKERKSVECGLETSPSSFGPLPPENQNLFESNDLTVEHRMAPMTKEQWERERNKIRRVYDPETGRNRLMRGSGEILEEIVSKKRHTEISKQATTGDGIFYQYKAGLVNK